MGKYLKTLFWWWSKTPSWYLNQTCWLKSFKKHVKLRKRGDNIFPHIFIFLLKETQMVPICKISFRVLKTWIQDYQMYSNWSNSPSPFNNFDNLSVFILSIYFQSLIDDGTRLPTKDETVKTTQNLKNNDLKPNNWFPQSIEYFDD